jgi:hypothetical protein
LADAELTSYLWISMIEHIKDVFGVEYVSFELMQRLTKIPKEKAPSLEKMP